MSNQNIKIFTLTGAKHFNNLLSKEFDKNFFEMQTSSFADGELLVKPNVSVRGCDVILIQSISKPVNDSLMELLIAIDACKRASAKSINVIITYFGYSRQDRKSKPREPITFKLIANIITNAGATRILTFDIHASQTQGFFDIPFDSIEMCWHLMSKFAKDKKIKNFSIVAPDYGSVKRARDLSLILNTDLIIIDKRRPKANEVEVNNVLGDCKDKVCIIVDDMIDTGNTMLESAKILKEFGAKEIYILATHGLFNKNAIEKFANAQTNKIINGVYVTDTINQNNNKFINIISIGNYICNIINRFEKGYASINNIICDDQQQLQQIINDKK